MESPEQHRDHLGIRGYDGVAQHGGNDKQELCFQNVVKIGKKHFHFEVKQFTLGVDANEERISKLTRQIIRIVEETRKGARGPKD